MTARSLTNGAALAAILAIGMTVGARAQEGQWRGGEPGMHQQWQDEAPGRYQRQGQGEGPGMRQDEGQDDESGPPEGWRGDGPRMRPGEFREGAPGMRMMRDKMMGGHGLMRMHAPLKIMFAILDTNGDGALSFEEITAAHKRIFDAIDVNKDGKITVEEIEAFLHQ